MGSAFLNVWSCPTCGSTNLQKQGFYTNKGIKRRKLQCRDCGKWMIAETEQPPKPDLQKFVEVSADKKVGEVHWREVLSLMKANQEQHKKASWSQDAANVTLNTNYNDIIFQPLSDLHIGSIASDYDSFLRYTNLILDTPNLYIALLGDLCDNFVNFRNMLAVHQQILSPEQQDEFIEDWINEIKHKVLFATWGNHEELEEKNTGRNIIKRVLKHNVIYMNGIGTAEININDKAKYKFAVTHKTRYNSSFNITHGLKQLARKDIPDADVYIAGDTHVPAMETAFERGTVQTFIKLGTLKVDDGYGKRYFSYSTSDAMPCAVLSADSKHVTSFWTIEEALKYANAPKLN